MNTAKTPHAAAIENQARVRASGINPTNDYGRWLLKLASDSRAHMCLARKGDGFLCIQAGDGAGEACQPRRSRECWGRRTHFKAFPAKTYTVPTRPARTRQKGQRPRRFRV